MRAPWARITTSLAGLLMLFLMPAAGAYGSGTDPASVDFGNVPLNTTVTRDIVITVDAGYQYAGAGGVSALNPPFGFDAGTCDDGGGLVGPGTCTAQESFTPTAVGDSQAQLQVLVCPTGVGSCVNLDVAIEGTGVSLTSANPATVSFGSVPLNTTATRDIVITVDAGYEYAGAGGVSALNPPFDFSGNTCESGGGFQGPGTCIVRESFMPPALGSYDAELNVLVCWVGDVHCFTLDISIHGSGKGNLAASAECEGEDLVVTIADGDGPLVVSATRPGLPSPVTYGTPGPGAVVLPSLGSDGVWWTVTIAETAGDVEELDLGPFSCQLPSDVSTPSPTASPAPSATPSPTPTATPTATSEPSTPPVPSPTVTPRPPQTGSGPSGDTSGPLNARWAAAGVLTTLLGLGLIAHDRLKRTGHSRSG